MAETTQKSPRSATYEYQFKAAEKAAERRERSKRGLLNSLREWGRPTRDFTPADAGDIKDSYNNFRPGII